MSSSAGKQNASWKKIIGILGIIAGVAAVALALVLLFIIYPGGTLSERPNLVYYLIALIGGAAAIIVGIILLLLKGAKKELAKPEMAEAPKEQEIKPNNVEAPAPEPKKELKVKCKNCGEIFAVSGTSGPLKCPACGSTGKVQ